MPKHLTASGGVHGLIKALLVGHVRLGSTGQSCTRPEGGHRVLIRTQPLGHNYGGLLQAFALQTIVRRLGHDVDTDISKPRTISFKGYLITSLRGTWQRLTRINSDDLVNAELIRFRDDSISCVSLYDGRGHVRPGVRDAYTDYLVGSDQVWRPKYSNIPASLFDFLPPSFAGKRLSYAASFGTDVSEYSAELVEATYPLAQRLDAVSVREDSGVDLVRELWGRDDAHWHVDPTLLLERSDYEKLLGGVGASPEIPPDDRLVVYFLDPSDPKKRLASELSSLLQRGVRSILPPAPDSAAAYRRSPNKFKKMPVTEWLMAFHDAEFVLTDSFHGCVFSVIFRKPFLVIENVKRGSTRFASLLNRLGLPHLMMDETDGDRRLELLCKAAQEIDWARIDKVLAVERARSLQYLSENLSSCGPSIPAPRHRPEGGDGDRKSFRDGQRFH